MTAEGERDFVEEAVGELYTAFYRLRKADRLQEEYDDMGTLMDMLAKDREQMRVKFKGQITI